jgi:hypoxia up-regulated 1
MLEQEDSTPRKDYEDKLKQLKAVTRDVFERVHELSERPVAIAALAQRVNHTEYFLVMMRNFTGEDLPYTQVEYDMLEKLVNETKEWNRTVTAEQAKTPLTEKPKFTVEDVGVKIVALERELNYLVNKMKNYRPKKPKPATKDKQSNATIMDSESAAGNETKTANDETKLPDGDDATGKQTTEKNLDRDILDDVDEKDSSTSRSSADSGHEPDDEL